MAHSRPIQAGNNLQTRVVSIDSLRSNQMGTQIRAKVTEKTCIKTYKNVDTEGVWFNVLLADESGEIRAVVYNADVNKYNEMLEVNKEYFVKNGWVRDRSILYGGGYDLTINSYTTVKLCTEDVEPAMAVVSIFKGLSELARLFDKCEFELEESRCHTISFREATERLRTAVENSLSDVEISTGRKVSEFRIGKASVTSQENQTFDPMKPMTWGEVGETFSKWQEHQQDKYDGLFEVGCVTIELIPKVIKETITAIDMDHQMYALVMAQALVHHYMVHEPDARLRSTSFDIGNWSEGEIGDEGGIIYVAYKLESENIQEDSLVIKEEQEGAASIPSLDDIASPPNADKDATVKQKDETFEASTSGPIQGAIHEKTPEEAHVSKVESEKGPKEEKIKKKKTTDKAHVSKVESEKGPKEEKIKKKKTTDEKNKSEKKD